MSCSGRVHFLVHSWSNICYLGFQSAVLIATVTAEVASSSLVVPAISFQRLASIPLKPKRVQKCAILHPFSTSYCQLEPFSAALLSRFDRVYGTAMELVLEAKTGARTAACAACFPSEIACV